MKGAIIVHGGAGTGRFGKEDRRYGELLRALEEGVAGLRSGSSLDSAERAVRYLEECGAFNAGLGACLTSEGSVELDAAVMSGKGRLGAGVGVVTCTHHPASLARWVAENTRHVLIAGGSCRKLAEEAGIPIERLKPSKRAAERYLELTKGRGSIASPVRRQAGGNTVGAVAIDGLGVPSAVVSTGGVWLKLPGRVGDSAILGAGIYADSRLGAACATGVGEEVIRAGLSMRACEFMKGSTAQNAAGKAVRYLTDRSGAGTGGMITVDIKGRVGSSHNTEAMPRAWVAAGSEKPTVRV